MSSPSVIHLAFLWHMHQPWYFDPTTGKLLLPWVRFHSVAAYSDMAALLTAHPQIKATINFSPTLLDQIALYCEGNHDIYEQLTLRPAAELSPEEREFLVRHFFSVNWSRAIAPLPRYLALLEKRGRDTTHRRWAEVAAEFSVEELRDLQVLFNLAWLGFSSREDQEIRGLLQRGNNYTEEDKKVLLGKQQQILKMVLPTWKKLQQRGSIEISASPYYHPILPLLIDSQIARRANPEARLPERFSFSNDAQAQIELAVSRIEKEFGARPVGMWPSEGAVCPEMLQLVNNAGLKYVSTDSEILFQSLDDRGSTPGRKRLYQSYRVGNCTVFFRDTRLANRISKEYVNWENAEAAAADFINEVKRVGSEAQLDNHAPPLVLVALDGENCWENYPQRGRDFLQALYSQLGKCAEIKTVTLAEHLEAHRPTVSLEHLYSGSWIEANFAMWIGDPEKNRAWNLLGRARKRLTRAQISEEEPPAILADAQRHLLRAESSDWFWWLGEPFSSAEDRFYDDLFRSNIMAMYRTLGDSPPAELSRPIEHGGVVETIRQPTTYISPRIDGARTSFYEWRGAGLYRVPAGGSLYQENVFINSVYWGFDPGRLFIRFDPAESYREGASPSLAELNVWIEITEPGRCCKGTLKLEPTPHLVLGVADGQTACDELGKVEEVGVAEVVEMAIPLMRLQLRPGSKIGLSVHFARGAEVLSRVPRQGVIEIEIPTDDFGAGEPL